METTNRETIKEVLRELLAEEVFPRLDAIKELCTKSPVGKTYTTKQAVEILKCDKSSLWRWAAEGKLVPIKQGGRNLYRHEDIERFVNN